MTLSDLTMSLRFSRRRHRTYRQVLCLRQLVHFHFREDELSCLPFETVFYNRTKLRPISFVVRRLHQFFRETAFPILIHFDPDRGFSFSAAGDEKLLGHRREVRKKRFTSEWISASTSNDETANRWH